MKKLWFVLVLVFILVLSVFVISAKENKSDKIEKKVVDELQKEGKARVIVVLKDSPTNDKKKISEFKANQRSEIKNKIDSTKIRNDFSYSNAFSASLSAEEIAALSLDDNVKQIYYDKPVSVSLQDSVPLINANGTWGLQSNGINLTGAGQTICIIDTGVDYTHPDLGNCTPVKYSLNGTVENLTTPLESAHPYVNNFDYTWNITKPGYSYIAIHFVNISLEYPGQGGYDSTDRIIIYNSNMKEIAAYHGVNGVITDLWTPYSDGEIIYVRLVSDYAVNNYGFYINQVINGTTNTTYNWNNCTKIINGWDFVNNDGDPKDDYGHGTHVAGIVAANGAIKGVAPDAKLIAAKSLDSSGNGYTSDVAAGIEWCTNRSEDFNISVISMSLGGTENYTSYCDVNDSVTSAAINSAVAKNISVVVAAGNSHNYTAISDPACIQNATPVGSSTKSDGISSFSNRNWMVQLFAPGSSINSTKNGGGYVGMDGTSMATPHVAGAFAILNQYLRSIGQTKTPQQIESTLNSTGKPINDSATNYTYSRINVYNAIISLDNQKPNVSLISPSSNLINNSADELNLTFKCNATDLLLKNITFYLWNSTSAYNQNSFNTSGASYSLEVNLTNITQGEYKWNCLAYDNNYNSASADSNFSLVYDKSIPGTSLISPSEGYSTTDTSISFSYNVSDGVSIANCSLIVNGAISAYNSSAITGGTNTISKSLSVGSYSWSVNCTDAAGNIGNSSTRSFMINASCSGCACTSSCGGGGGGGSPLPTSKVYDITSTELSEGYNAALNKGDKIEFQSNSESHTLTTNNIGTNFVNITISSNPTNIKLAVGDSAKLNLSSKDYYDFYVKLESIISGKANITIKSIYEQIIGVGESKPNVNNTRIISAINGGSTSEPTSENKGTSNWLVYVIALIVLGAILFGIYWLIKTRRLRKRGRVNLNSFE
jgi:subtilisin family serine protease